MKIDILTLFPHFFDPFLETSIVGRSVDNQLIHPRVINFRDFSKNKHHKVDDYPYGGGRGMLLTPEPIFDAVDYAKGENKGARIILLCPQGERFTQAKAEAFAKEEHLIFICGHYEGFDERIRQHLVTDEISLGDFVLTGGEPAAQVIVDAIVRLVPGVLPVAEAHENDSFSSGLLEYPQYTRPEDFRGLKVPDVLLSGHHENIEKWRREEALRKTLIRRPDLLETAELSDEDLKMLDKIKKVENL